MGREREGETEIKRLGTGIAKVILFSQGYRKLKLLVSCIVLNFFFFFFCKIRESHPESVATSKYRTSLRCSRLRLRDSDGDGKWCT